MSGTKEIKYRIKSIKNTKKITKAMEMVSASKMRKAVGKTLNSRAYALYAAQILRSLPAGQEEFSAPLLKIRPVKNILVMLVTSNRGLCGVYNAQAIRKCLELFKIIDTHSGEPKKVHILSVGKKAEQAMGRMGREMVASFADQPDDIKFSDSLPISSLMIEGFISEKYDQVIAVYTDYKSALTQVPRAEQLLPISREILEQSLSLEDAQNTQITQTEYVFEPNAEEFLTFMTEKLVRYEVFQMLLESKSSEESARMLAMKNANEAAGEMIEDLTMVFNKARQSGITQEISEISAGMTALQ